MLDVTFGDKLLKSRISIHLGRPVSSHNARSYLVTASFFRPCFVIPVRIDPTTPHRKETNDLPNLNPASRSSQTPTYSVEHSPNSLRHLQAFSWAAECFAHSFSIFLCVTIFALGCICQSNPFDESGLQLPFTFCHSLSLVRTDST